MNRSLVVVAALLGLLGALGVGVNQRRHATEQRPPLALLTSLPILFSEQFSLNTPSSPLRKRLEADYQLQPIGVTDAQSLKGQRLLFMAHARAQPAAALADLDRWVRDGGHLLILTDPLLSWHSDRPLGDSLRPPVSFADTALLAHWGLSLSGPQPMGEAQRSIDGGTVVSFSPGSLATRGGCMVEKGGFVARCAIDKGRVTLIADADWLTVAMADDEPSDPNSDAASDAASQSLDALTRELARLR